MIKRYSFLMSKFKSAANISKGVKRDKKAVIKIGKFLVFATLFR
jgi:hypothetical protein